MKQCKDCRFWEQLGNELDEDDGSIEGLCRRYPPSVRINENHEHNRPPITYGHEWCGEWKEK